MENIKIKGFHDLSINAYIIEPKGKTKGIIQIIHGMQEHATRYEQFMKFLAQNGYIAFASDLRGHGESVIENGKYGYGETDIFEEIIQDQQIIYRYLKGKYKLPVYVFGHSFGSFITQRFMQVNPEIKKFVVCGTTDGSKMLYKFGKLISSFYITKKSKSQSAKLIESMSLKSYAKKFDRGNWLSRDESVWDKYQADPLCGQSFPVSFYQSMFYHMNKLNSGIKQIRSDTKIFLIAGNQDPVGNYGKYVNSLYAKYMNAGKDAQIKLYNGARHELLNETNKEEVFSDILKFFNE